MDEGVGPGTVLELIETSAARNPLASAFSAPARPPLTYGALLDQIHDAICALEDTGISSADRVALVLPDGPEAAVASLAVSAFATCAPLNPGFHRSELEFYLSDLGASTVIVPAGGAPLARSAADALGIRVLELSPALEAEAGRFSISRSPRGPSPARQRRRDLARPDDVALLLHTSGSTSRSKLVPLSQRNLVHSADNIRGAFELTADDCCLNVMPLFHIAGLGAMFGSLAAGAGVFCPPGFQAPLFLDWLEVSGATWYTAVPTMHQAILSRVRSGRRPGRALRFIRSSGAPLSAWVIDELETVFQTSVSEAYGMTEASQISSNPILPALKKRGSVGAPSGSSVAILGEDGSLLPALTQGEIAIRGPHVTRGYAGDPEANRNTFSGGWFRTGDLGYLDEDGYLFITGRLKESINRGGEKVSPREIEDALSSHRAVAQAVAFPVPDSLLGEEIAAAVVLHDGATVGERELIEWASERLAHFKTPRRVKIVREIPKKATGKFARLELAQQLGITIQRETEPSSPAFAAPSTRVEHELARIWCNVLHVKRVGVHDDFFRLGGDSVLATMVLARIREELGAELSFTVFFGAPTVAEMASSVATAARSSMTTISPTLGDREPMLSPGQERLWFLEQSEPRTPVHNITFACTLLGRLDRRAVEDSLQEIVRRHEVLRTTFRNVGGRPEMVIRESTTMDLAFADLRGLAPAERDREASRRLEQNARLPFDIEKEIPIRGQLMQTGDEEHVLLLVLHHIAGDAWSKTVLLRELRALYEGFVGGQPPPHPTDRLEYKDIAAWQKHRLEDGSTLPRLCDYWVRQLAGAPPVLDVPADRPRPDLVTYRGACRAFVVPKSLGDRLNALSRAEGVTLFMTLLAAFNVLLSRWSGATDIVVGSPIANRTFSELEGVIGFLANTLALRTSLDGDPTVRELLQRTRQATVAAYEHQDLSFERLAVELKPPRDLSRNPIFQVMFVFQNSPTEMLALPGLEVIPFEVETGTSKFDLTLVLVQRPDGLHATFEYATDLFEPETIERMAGQFETLLRSVVHDPTARVSALEILRDEERRQILIEWNATERSYPQQPLHVLVAEQVERTPEAIAVSCEGHELSYRALDARSNQLAHHLRRAGVGRDQRVAICAERSLEMVVGLLGVLKAGAAYVPLDPQSPPERLGFMLSDCRPEVILTQERLGPALRAALGRTGAPVLCLDQAGALDGESERHRGLPATSMEDLAYGIYTSGSTGKPKNALNTHAGVVNRLLWMQDAYRLTAADRVLQKTPFTFDVSVWELFWPLIAGARLVMARPHGHKDSAYLVRTIQAEQITTLHFVPSMLQIFLDEPNLGACTSLRRVIASGEALPYDLTERFHARMSAELHNLYGPTEAAIDVTAWPCSRTPSDRRTIPIGRPIANVTTYVLDPHGQPVPIGVTGELHIGGVALARGYLNQPQLTAERFVRDPFSADPRARLYKTGDLAAYRADGVLEFHGRIDQQVKIRGFRIELGEIECVLCEHPSVREAVVVVRAPDPPTEPRLVAYVVARHDAQPQLAALRAFLEDRLPDYMVPAAIVLLPAIPLTSSGKVDRSALPAPDASAAVTAPFVAPTTHAERALAQIWCELLGRPSVGVEDNFFDLGGHSMLAMQVLKRLESSFSAAEVTITDLFRYPTVRTLARRLVGAIENGASDGRDPSTRLRLRDEAARRRERRGRRPGQGKEHAE